MVSIALIGVGDKEQANVPLPSQRVASRTVSGAFRQNLQQSMIPNLSATSDIGDEKAMKAASGRNTSLRAALTRVHSGTSPETKSVVIESPDDTLKFSDAKDGNSTEAAATELVANIVRKASKVPTDHQDASVEETAAYASSMISQTNSSRDKADAGVASHGLAAHARDAVDASGSESEYSARVAQAKREAKKRKTGEAYPAIGTSVPADTSLLTDARAQADAAKISSIGQPAQPPVVAATASDESTQDLKKATAPRCAYPGRASVMRGDKKAPMSPKEKIAGTEERTAGAHTEVVASRTESHRLNETAGSSGDGISPLPHDRTEKPYGTMAENSGIPLQSSVKDQLHVVMDDSSADKMLSVSRHAHLAREHSEASPVDLPAVSTSGHKVLATTPSMLEVGVASGSHGWLKIRAEVTGDGTVHASVAATSVVGDEMLRRELPALETYLHQEQVSVGSLVIHPSAGMQDFSSMGQGVDYNGAGRQQHHREEQSDRGQEKATSVRGWSKGFRADGTDDWSTAWFPQVPYAGNGGWLSVRA